MENPKTGELMSKSNGTGVFLDTSVSEMYGAIMAQPDEMIKVLLINCTRIPLSEIEKIENMENKRDAKMRTAFEVVKKIHSEKDAQYAEGEFVKTFQKHEVPEDIEEYKKQEGENLVDILSKSGVASSKTEARRLVVDGAISSTTTKEKITDVNYEPKETDIFKIGKKRFLRVKI